MLFTASDSRAGDGDGRLETRSVPRSPPSPWSGRARRSVPARTGGPRARRRYTRLQDGVQDTGWRTPVLSAPHGRWAYNDCAERGYLQFRETAQARATRGHARFCARPHGFSQIGKALLLALLQARCYDPGYARRTRRLDGYPKLSCGVPGRNSTLATPAAYTWRAGGGYRPARDRAGRRLI